MAEKLKQQADLMNKSQKAADEFAEIKNEYPKGKTVEEFEKHGMRIIRTIYIDNQAIRIYLKVVHDWELRTILGIISVFLKSFIIPN